MLRFKTILIQTKYAKLVYDQLYRNGVTTEALRGVQTNENIGKIELLSSIVNL